RAPPSPPSRTPRRPSGHADYSPVLDADRHDDARKVCMTTTTPLSPLDADGVAAAVEEALAAISAASSLEELKAARLAHTGDRAPLTLANREIGRLDPKDKATAGKLLGQARSEERRVGKAPRA